MKTFICDRCQHEFESKAARPPCPQGCRYPIEKSSVSADLITTRPVDVVESQPTKLEPDPAPEGKPLDKMNRAELRKVAAAKGIEFDANETKAKLRAKIISADEKPPELPEDEAPESSDASKMQDSWTPSLDNGEKP